MINNRPTVMWDFDGTLVKPTSWRGVLMDVLTEFEPGHKIDSEQLRPFLKDGFPWDKSQEPHLQLSTPEFWWANLQPLFVRTYEGIGFSPERAKFLAQHVRAHIVNPNRYHLYEDTIYVLTGLKEKGWRNVILSNNMPELPEIVAALGLSQFIDYCLVSALTGYEKPNSEAFNIALSAFGNPERIWMVGDNIFSDVRGAESLGMPAILVHNKQDFNTKYQAPTLMDVLKTVTSITY